MAFGPLTTPSRGQEIRALHVAQMTAIFNAASAGLVLKGTGAGVVDWAALTSAEVVAALGFAPPNGGGSAGQVGYWSDADTLTGSAGLKWDEATQSLGIGNASGVPGVKLHVVGTVEPQLQVEGDGIVGGLEAWTFTNDADAPYLAGMKWRGARGAGKRAQASDVLLFVGGGGGYGANDVDPATGPAYDRAAIDVQATEAFTVTAQGARLRFHTTPTGSTTRAERWRIEQNGNLIGQGTVGITIPGPLDHDGTTVGLYGVAPVARAAAYTQTYATAVRSHANPTATALTDNSSGTSSSTIANINGGAASCQNATVNAVASLAARINALVVDVANVKQVLNSVVDDLQAVGLVQ